MSKVYEEITDELAAWNQQHMFFVATAPLAASGHVNCSPKGLLISKKPQPSESSAPDGVGSKPRRPAAARSAS
jgi:hypothetical protein